MATVFPVASESSWILFFLSISTHILSINKDKLLNLSFPGGSVVKDLPANAGGARDAVSIPGLRRSPGEGNGNPLQYSCLGNSMDRGAWQAIVYGVPKSWT